MNEKQQNINEESFADLFAKHVDSQDMIEGKVVTGKIISIENDMVIIDVGYKAEGRIHIREFQSKDSKDLPEVGDSVDVCLEKLRIKMVKLFYLEKKQDVEAWKILEKATDDKVKVSGTIFGRVKGGFSVDLEGAMTFLQSSRCRTH